MITPICKKSSFNYIPVTSYQLSNKIFTFSVSKLVTLSQRFCVKTILNTPWDRLLVAFMFVAATVLKQIVVKRNFHKANVSWLALILSWVPPNNM